MDLPARIRQTQADRQADRRVSEAHNLATRQPNPVVYMRQAQADAEARYAETGDSRDLALVRAFARSLDGETA